MTTKTKATKTAPRANANPPAPAPAPATPKGGTLQPQPDAPGMACNRLMAQAAAAGILGNARALVDFATPNLGELSLFDCAMVLKETAQGLNDGDLSAAVTMLAVQAVALNAMFVELARVGQANMFKAPDYADRYLRLAFKAQGQSRATLETLAAIKNPPVLFARQANINNGGQQQVNNGPARDNTAPDARPGETASRPNEQSEASHELLKDTGTSQTAIGTNPNVATVGMGNRATHA